MGYPVILKFKREKKTFYSFEKKNFKNFPTKEYKGGLYWSDTASNPYKVLVDLSDDVKENSTFVMHKNTCYVCDDAFDIGENRYNSRKFKRLYINDTYNYDVLFIWGVDAECIYYYGAEPVFYNLLRIGEQTSGFYAPNLDWKKINRVSTKILLCCGLIYVKNNNEEYCGTYAKKCDDYMLKNNKRFFDLLVKREDVLNYFLSCKLLKYENIHDLLLKIDNQSFKDKVIEYRDTLFKRDYEEELANKKEIILSDEIGEKKYDVVATTESKNIYEEKINISNPKKRKAANYIKKTIEPGELFLGRCGREFLLLEAVKSTGFYTRGLRREHAGAVIFKMVDIYKVGSSKNSLVAFSSFTGVDLIKKSVIWDALISSKSVTENGEIVLGIEKGLFRTTICNNKKSTISQIFNTKEWFLSKEEYEVFDYFSIVNGIVFRHIKDVADLNKYFELSDEYLINLLNLKTGTLRPYDIKYNLPEKFINAAGKEYNYLDLLRNLSKMSCVADRDFSITMFYQYFSDFYQKNKEYKMEGFSTDDIKTLIDDNFYQDIKTGFYYYYDTVKEYKNGIYLYDKQWFKMFFDYIKTHKNTKIEKISDIVPVRNNKSFYGEYIIEQDKFKFFYDIVKQCDYVDEFYAEIEKYLMRKMDSGESFIKTSAIKIEDR